MDIQFGQIGTVSYGAYHPEQEVTIIAVANNEALVVTEDGETKTFPIYNGKDSPIGKVNPIENVFDLKFLPTASKEIH